MSFPLYTTLSKNVPDKKLSPMRQRKIVKKIHQWGKNDTHAFELIYALIKCHYLECDKNDGLNIPYNGVIKDDYLQFNVTKLPNKLQHILYNFVMKHDEQKNFINNDGSKNISVLEASESRLSELGYH
tara:strand:- start:29 stop:412 length:384 start_codon:yes stop_codon:yes gene_type:complete